MTYFTASVVRNKNKKSLDPLKAKKIFIRKTEDEKTLLFAFAQSKQRLHFDNNPIEYTAYLNGCKNDNVRLIFLIIFLYCSKGT